MQLNEMIVSKMFIQQEYRITDVCFLYQHHLRTINFSTRIKKIVHDDFVFEKNRLKIFPYTKNQYKKKIVQNRLDFKSFFK